MFDPVEGTYWRSPIQGIEGNKSPFMASFPHLIDVGIMGHCKHGLSGKCILSGVECYQNGPNISEPYMSVNDFRRLAEECDSRTFQFALGGRGDVDEHEAFEEILKICGKHHIVPNFTTSGYTMNKEKARISKQYCGAVAVSWYNKDYTYEAIRLLLDAGVKTNVHYVLSNSSIEEAIMRIQYNRFPKGINGIIFLLHKPVGLGTKANTLTVGDARVALFLREVMKTDRNVKIGFDSCIVPAFVNSGLDVDFALTDTCEGARFSCYISPTLKMTPCSFDQDEKWAVDIRSTSVAEGWNSKPFKQFREILQTACPNCPDREQCLGGCPINGDIVLCARKEKTTESGGCFE
jgi:radical SAM protein with 4Fe4S-binding SPASM domain